MNKTELAAKVAQAINEPNTKAVAQVSAVFEAIATAVAGGEEVNIADFGKFKVMGRPARVGRNPRTGETVDIPAKRALIFRPGLGLRSRLNEKAPAKRAKSK